MMRWTIEGYIDDDGRNLGFDLPKPSTDAEEIYAQCLVLLEKEKSQKAVKE